MLKIVENLLGGGGSDPNPAVGAYSAPTDPLAGGEGLAELHPALGLRRPFSAFRSRPQ